MYGLTRGLVTLLAAGVAGLLIWFATQVNDASTGGYWAVYGLIAAAGLVMALSQLLGGWTKGGLPRLSANVFLLAFIPVLIAAGWVEVAHQPHPNWARNHVLSWSGDIGILGLVRDLTEYVSVLAFGIGLVFGYSFDTTPPETRGPVEPGRRRTAVAPDSSTDGVVHTRDDGTPVPMRDRTADGTPVTAPADTPADTTVQREPVRR
jgi:hypothetical protein